MKLPIRACKRMRTGPMSQRYIARVDLVDADNNIIAHMVRQVEVDGPAPDVDPETIQNAREIVEAVNHEQ